VVGTVSDRRAAHRRGSSSANTIAAQLAAITNSGKTANSPIKVGAIGSLSLAVAVGAFDCWQISERLLIL
jgi:hypothetical protein